MFNVVSTCAYGNTPDKLKQNDVWNERLTELENNGVQQKDIELYKIGLYTIVKEFILKIVSILV